MTSGGSSLPPARCRLIDAPSPPACIRYGVQVTAPGPCARRGFPFLFKRRPDGLGVGPGCRLGGPAVLGRIGSPAASTCSAGSHALRTTRTMSRLVHPLRRRRQQSTSTRSLRHKHHPFGIMRSFPERMRGFALTATAAPTAAC